MKWNDSKVKLFPLYFYHIISIKIIKLIFTFLTLENIVREKKLFKKL